MAELGVVDPPQDGSPSWDEVEQREGIGEFPILAVPVHLDGPAQVQQLPPRTSVLRSLAVTNAGAVELLAKDPRRARAVIIAVGDGIVLGLDSNGAASTGFGFRWPAGLPLEVRGWSRVMVSAQTGAGAVVSVLAESWAD
jgi:hypothetical protein